ncbi:hypothetical protein GCM10022247_38920 [Allokutzneria multivorans]|uniref:Secreted protein n=1 Tax=Allokutzneria multivorans TaxID=1142134 RepID=A0ABP7SJK9_9PSEU
MRKNLRAVVVMATTIIATAAVVAPASANLMAEPVRCGYDESTPTGHPERYRDAKYNHCASTRVEIWVDYVSQPDRSFCTSPLPWVYYLGRADQVNNAWYTGRLC